MKGLSDVIDHAGFPNRNREQCEHYTVVEYESITKKTFEVLVRCSKHKNHFGNHYSNQEHDWTSTHSYDKDGKRIK